MDENPELMSAPVDYTNDIRSISSLDNFISINNAVDIDLFGQVNAESAGVKHISGAGGQLDFVLGAYLSNGGKSFICLSSTFKDKDGNLKSRIRPTLAGGSIVTDTRANIHYVVTEHGKVNLKGLSTWQKAEALISIAHPDFRDELISIVTDTRANIHYVVTEHGKVNLKGLSTWQKAEALISIAHPDFRDELIAEAEKMNIWRRSNK